MLAKEKLMLVRNSRTGKVSKAPLDLARKLQRGTKFAGDNWRVVADPDKPKSHDFKKFKKELTNGK